MPDRIPFAEPETHTRCRNLIFESSPENGDPVPGRYCVSRAGTIQVMDCPVFQGLPCCLFEARAEDEGPTVADEDRLDAVRADLTLDYLRWTYWKRVSILRGAEPPEEPEEVVEESPEALPEEDEEIVRHEIPPPKEEALKEKYPGQRRSEDRRRGRRGALDDEAGPADDFSAGIFSDPLADEAPTTAPEEDAAPAVAAEPEPEPGAGDEKGKPQKGSRSKSAGRPRRRVRRRRSRKGGKGSGGPKPPA
jgi:hypothetical protein